MRLEFAHEFVETHDVSSAFLQRLEVQQILELFFVLFFASSCCDSTTRKPALFKTSR